MAQGKQWELALNSFDLLINSEIRKRMAENGSRVFGIPKFRVKTKKAFIEPVKVPKMESEKQAVIPTSGNIPNKERAKSLIPGFHSSNMPQIEQSSAFSRKSLVAGYRSMENFRVSKLHASSI